ncbi:hypothetical protein, partial [Pseudolysinimonas sp.]|uniref:hypothetical protein n=1 Tax=Pseudolysinimonas sp. TaxID=2680009 RepID=UPI003F8086A4
MDRAIVDLHDVPEALERLAEATTAWERHHGAAVRDADVVDLDAERVARARSTDDDGPGHRDRAFLVLAGLEEAAGQKAARLEGELLALIDLEDWLGERSKHRRGVLESDR